MVKTPEGRRSETYLAAAEVNKKFVLTKCSYFVDVQLWPFKQDLDPEGWLSNFKPAEMEHAIHLLNGFMFFRQPLMRQMFYSAFQNMSTVLVRPNQSFGELQAEWRSFVDNTLITRVTGERPSDTDSGFHFERMARQALGIAEERIAGPQEILQYLLSRGASPVVFVDDFVGSGDQFVKTWRRPESVPGHGEKSFEQVATEIPQCKFFYCPLVCTEKGRLRIATACPQVVVCPAHFLPSKYSALAEDSVIWPTPLRDSGPEFVRNASLRAGIKESHIGGFDDLGLALAFEHSVPDATLPLFYADKNNWHPLVRRT